MVADLFGKSKTQGERTTAIFSILIEPSRRAGYHKWFLTRIFPRRKSVHDRGKIIFATVVKFYDLSTRQISIARFNNINCTVIAPLLSPLRVCTMRANRASQSASGAENSQRERWENARRNSNFSWGKIESRSDFSSLKFTEIRVSSAEFLRFSNTVFF